jgi:hypothetical protein
MIHPILLDQIGKERTKERMRDVERWRLLSSSLRPRRLGSQMCGFVLWLGAWPICWGRRQK